MIARTAFRFASSLLFGGLLLAASSCDIHDETGAGANGLRTGSYAPRLVMADDDSLLPVGMIVATQVGATPVNRVSALWSAGEITLDGLPLDQDVWIRIEGWVDSTLIWSGLKQIRLTASNPATGSNLDDFLVTYSLKVDTPTLASGVSTTFADSIEVHFDAEAGDVIRYERGAGTPVTRSSPEYDPADPPRVTETGVIRARAYRLGVPSPVAVFRFQKVGAAGPSAPELDASVSLTFSTSFVLKFQAVNGIEIFYTTDGSSPVLSSNSARRRYDPLAPETLQATTTIKAVALRTSDQKYSDSTEWTFEKMDDAAVGKPILPGNGTIHVGQQIVIDKPSIGICPQIRFQTNGQSPVGPSATYLSYAGAIEIPPAWKDSTVTLIAACIDDDGTAGDTVTGVYQVREATMPAELQAVMLGTNWPVSGSGRHFIEAGGRKLAATDIGLYEYSEQTQSWMPAETWPTSIRSVIDLAATTTDVYALTPGGICIQDIGGSVAWDCLTGDFGGFQVGPNRMLANDDELLVSTDALGVLTTDLALDSLRFLVVANANTLQAAAIQSLAPLGDDAMAYVGFEGSFGRLFVGDASSVRMDPLTLDPYLSITPFDGVADAVSISPAPPGGTYAAYLGTRSAVFGLVFDAVDGRWRLDKIGTAFASENAVREVVQVGDRLYAATQTGAYWHSATSTAGAWTRIANSPEQVNRISVSGARLNLAARDGVWVVALP